MTVLASDCDDVLFMAQFVDTPWVVYADVAHVTRISTQVMDVYSSSCKSVYSST